MGPVLADPDGFFDLRFAGLDAELLALGDDASAAPVVGHLGVVELIWIESRFNKIQNEFPLCLCLGSINVLECSDFMDLTRWGAR